MVIAAMRGSPLLLEPTIVGAQNSTSDVEAGEKEPTIFTTIDKEPTTTSIDMEALHLQLLRSHYLLL